jgi:hypothetical protein
MLSNLLDLAFIPQATPFGRLRRRMLLVSIAAPLISFDLRM